MMRRLAEAARGGEDPEAGQELEEAGAVKNVKTVLSEYKQMGKGVSDDEAFRYNAESALVFYRTKSYDVLTAVRLQS